jgi:HEAT repeat protein
MADNAPGPAESAEATEVRSLVLRAVTALPESERVAVSLFYIENRSHREVADFLAVPVSTVKSRLHSARGRLKEKLMGVVEEELRKHAPDERFTQRVALAIEVYTSKGPPRDHIGSEHWHNLRRQTIEILRSGDEGLQMDVELSRSEHARARCEAALHFRLRNDPRGKEHVLRLMRDANARVRRQALKSYAWLTSPVDEEGRRFEAHNAYDRWASEVPEGIERLFDALDDSDVKVRWYCVLALRPYARLGDDRVEAALRKALKDAKHKIRHSAALALGIACPGCGAKAEDGD